MNKQIALVEDDRVLADQYARALLKDGHHVDIYFDGSSAKKALVDKLPDLVVLDVGLPEGAEAGFALCRQLREQSARLPILFMTGRDEELDLISGLRMGADDYLTKDISLHQLRARVNAALARDERLNSKEAPTDPIQHVGELEIDHQRMQVHYNKFALNLTLTEFAILVSLVRHPGHVRSRDQLMDDADLLVDLATITSYVKRLRKKLVELDPEFDCIESVYGYGYRWNTKA